MEAIIWLLNTTGNINFKIQKGIGELNSVILKGKRV